ncbi:hypothetical protein UFOVP1146_269 [uncultured Caudovirales phage]|jgi:hypothetical protein|uniref:Uncharacterized protein n=1 Tax=uncultured Caudovirales phage TaxID=2100421 RepID=A0A6J5NXY0_9CAUD|nr:hypothetical protein UFOVP812_182 [uncultured Caudovirales phage]CAB4165847.1 hypothetical protein UFOVP818_383 [uncultured Caudovirales phage]CAB4186923.1 hypothetical protein UFOVP1146_269 [uncultured Caudovirales phage]CAB4221390.1 hypothetical protein UFOVP1638_296 [uncultured Caudovirales phage]
MASRFVLVKADVHCSWSKAPPRYRVYVNDELFAERTWIWRDVYLEENLQITADVGDYVISFHLIKPHRAELRVENVRVDIGPGHIVNGSTLRITE